MNRHRRIAHLRLSTILAYAGAGVWGAAFAQEPTPATPAEVEEEASEILFEADSVYRDHEDGPIIAEGNVRAFFGERYLRANRLSYNPTTDVVIAEGNVSITDENLETSFAGRVELSGDLRDGIAENFSALLENNARLAAQSAIQEQGARTKLRRAVYTSCNVCDDEGEQKTPTWRIKSLRVTRDLERRIVRFNHAFLELKGVPIIYTPFFQAPDPSVERQSGFLAPNLGGTSSRLGFNFELPYYLAISNHQDATFSPLYTAKDGVLWQGEWRRRGRDSYHVLSGGVINFDNEQTPDEDIPGVRWHYFGRGYQDFGDNWRVSYDVERVSDNTYLRNYGVERSGDLRQALNRGSTNQLRSNARVAWNSSGSKLTLDTYLFQGLRTSDDSSKIPYILPLIDYKHQFSTKIAGGSAYVGANIASLYRTDGTDSQRLTTNAFWDRSFITNGGHRFNLFAEARGDLYLYQDLEGGTEICSDATAACAENFPGLTAGESTSTQARFVPTVGAEWSYPLARNMGSARLYLEPRVQLLASTTGQNPDDIINDDSQSIEFDYAGLFDYNKATGYDAFEDGQRANVGILASAEWENGFAVEGSIGQQFRIQSTDAFDSSSGLGDTQSDVVGSFNVRFGRRLGIENRFRIDSGDASFRRIESRTYLNTNRFSASANYIRLNEENVANNLVRREELTATGRLKLTDHWSTAASWRVDLDPDAVTNPDTNELEFPSVQTIRQDFSLNYEDECSTFGIIYRRDLTQTTNLEPDNAFLVTFTLKSLVE